MASPKRQPIDGSKKPRAMSTQDFESSNSTTAAFLGGKQKDWMVTDSGHGIICRGNPPLATVAPSLDPDIEIISDTQTTEYDKALKPASNRSNDYELYDLSSVPFSPNFDRGRFPALRRRRGGSKHHTSLKRSNPSMANMPESNSPQAIETSEHSISRPFSSLPSPTPSIETRRPSTNLIDVGSDTATTESRFRNRFESLVAEFGGIEEVKRHLLEVETQGQTGAGPLADARETHQPTIPTGPASSHELDRATERTPISDRRDAPQDCPNSDKDNSIESSEPPNCLRSLTEGTVVPAEVAMERHVVRRGRNHLDLRSSQLQLSRRLHDISLSSNRTGIDVESPRLGLLNDACDRCDNFYLCLHQIFCLNHLRRAHKFPSLQDEHRNGLSVLSYLLVSNARLSLDALEWFSNFPIHRDRLSSSRIYLSAYPNVLECLLRLSTNWDLLHKRCEQRGFPPLVDELVTSFNIQTFTFQQVIFRALLRDIWKGGHDTCFQQIEDVFSQSFRETALRALTGLPKNGKDVHNRAVMSEFQRITATHHHHIHHEWDVNLRAPPLNPSGQPIMHVTQNLNTANGPWSPSNNFPVRGHDDGNGSATQGSHVRISAPINSTLGTPPQSGSVPNHMPPNRHPTLQYPNRPANASPQQAGVLSQSSTMRPVPQGSVHRNYATPPGQEQAPGNFRHSTNWPSHMHSASTQDTPSGLSAPHVLPSNVQGQRPSIHAQNFRPCQQHLPQFIRINNTSNTARPNPAVTALHQSQVQSPILTLRKVQGTPSQTSNYLRYIKNVIMPPRTLSGQRRHVTWDFGIHRAVMENLVEHIPSLHGLPPIRTFLPGSQLYRIRCVEVNSGAELPQQNEWVTLDNVWPESTAIIFNGTAMEIRRKVHHGKDMPIDITSFVKEGRNEISIAMIGLPANAQKRYAIGVENIEVAEESLIIQNVPEIPTDDARQRILDRSQSLDPDIQVIRSQTVLDLTDPFTTKLFDVPIRGMYCRHNQCFDRDNFLLTRRSKNANEPSPPDAFRCPVCGLDARPQSLVIDGFFVKVREGLAKKGRLDAKAIILNEDGWDIKEEEPAKGEQGDGSGRRSYPRERQSAEKQNIIQDIIAIDDD